MTKNVIDEEKLLQQVTAILGPNGLLVKSGKTFNKNQLNYARSAASGFCRYDALTGKASLNILEASTGTGKTIGYLVPLMLFAAQTGERVAVSTFTRQLQKQIVDDDAKLVNEWVKVVTGVTLSCARRVGLANFVSTSACESLLQKLENDSTENHDDAIKLLNDLILWSSKPSNSGLLDDFLEDQNLTSFPDSISYASICLTRNAPEIELEKYRQAVNLSKDADVLVANHALVILNSLRWSNILDDIDKRPIALLVCDEADQLASVAESVVGVDLPLHKMMQIIRNFADKIGVPLLAKPFEELLSYVMSLQPPHSNLLVLNETNELSKMIKSAKRSLIPLEKAIASRMGSLGNLISNDENVETLNFIDLANDLSDFCASLKSEDNTAIISWSPVRSYPSLRVSQDNPGRLLSRMWTPYEWDVQQSTTEENPAPIIKRSYLRSALFTSATLATPGRDTVEQFDEFARSIGIIRQKDIHNTRTELYSIYEPTKFGSMSFVLADPRAPRPSKYVEDDIEKTFITSEEWLDYAASLCRAAHNNDQRCLVLSLSFKDTESLAKRLSDIPDLIVHQQRQPLRTYLSQYIENPRAMLISPSAWEGVNLPGMVNNLVIPRLPFAPIDAITNAQFYTHLKSKGFSDDKIMKILHNAIVSKTRKRFKQGLGRGIRDKNDSVTVWIGDVRLPLPESVHTSLDDIIMSSKSGRVHKSMLTCIPRRFLQIDDESGEGYNNAKLWLIDGTLYQPSIF